MDLSDALGTPQRDTTLNDREAIDHDALDAAQDGAFQRPHSHEPPKTSPTIDLPANPVEITDVGAHGIRTFVIDAANEEEALTKALQAIEGEDDDPPYQEENPDHDEWERQNQPHEDRDDA